MDINLLDGRTIDTGIVRFNSTSYFFTDSETGEDLTDLITRADKLKFSGFDTTKENERLYQKQYAATHGGATAPSVGSTSATATFFDLTRQDIIGATKFATTQVVRPITETIIIFGIAGLVAYVLLSDKK